MTRLNQWIRSAKDGAAEIVITGRDVSSLAEHCRVTQFHRLPKTDIEQSIRAGGMKLLGVPVRVVG